LDKSGGRNPAPARGSRQERVNAFRVVRDELAQRVVDYCSSLDEEATC